MAWSLVRHPTKSRDFPAKHERLVTADELRPVERKGYFETAFSSVRAWSIWS
jgi:hypothetical protein